MVDGTADGTADGRRAALHAPFRPVRARRTAWTVAVVEFTVLAVIAVVLPATGPVGFRLLDRLGMVAVGGLVAWLLLRFARIEAVPDEAGLQVRNLLVSTRLEWPRVTRVRFGGGDPWVTLDLDDGDTLAVMAVQRADGDLGTREAARLATLHALHTPR